MPVDPVSKRWRASLFWNAGGSPVEPVHDRPRARRAGAVRAAPPARARTGRSGRAGAPSPPAPAARRSPRRAGSRRSARRRRRGTPPRCGRPARPPRRPTPPRTPPRPAIVSRRTNWSRTSRTRSFSRSSCPPVDRAAPRRGEPRRVGELRRLADVLDGPLLARSRRTTSTARQVVRSQLPVTVRSPPSPAHVAAEREQPTARARLPDPLLVLAAARPRAPPTVARMSVSVRPTSRSLPSRSSRRSSRAREARLLADEVQPEPLRPVRAARR